MLITANFVANVFQPLISVFADVIKFFHDSLGISWGWSIVLLTVSVRLALSPLMVKQFHSMRRMQQHQPQMKAIQQKYKGDRQRQNEEMMKFYRENSINPMASCLPMLAQAPVLISLFYMLEDNLRKDICLGVQQKFQAHYAALHHISLHAAQGQTTYCGKVPGAGFLFIHDITNKATGVALIVLILLYIGTQVASMAVSMMQSPTMDQKQQRLMMLMPVVFVIFIIRFPAGLLVYWITSNAWTMAQGYGMRWILGPPPPVATVGAAGAEGTGGGGVSGKREGPKEPSAGGLGGLWRGLSGGSTNDEASSNGRKSKGGTPSVNSGGTPATPPRPPRKKKKRSGRRR